MEMVTEEEVNPKPSLIILKLSLENFKSYGGTVELGPFHKVIWPTYFSDYHCDKQCCFNRIPGFSR